MCYDKASIPLLQLGGDPPGPGPPSLLASAMGWGSLELGCCPSARLCPPVPPSSRVCGGKRMVPLQKYMQRLPWLPPRPCRPGLAHCIHSATSFRRVLWIYFCIYKYNVRMARTITNNIHDTAVNGARCKVWLPGTLAHAGR